MRPRRSSKRYYGVAVLLVILAFSLRLWGLTATSLWYDETFMITHAQQGILAGTVGLLREDNALPLHGLLLALWIKLAGSGEFVVRYLSVLLGTVAAALVLRLGGAVMGRRYSGWGGALAFATLPIFVYYTQEVRMYALAVPLAAAFAWMSWRLYRWGRGAKAYVALGGLMLAAHLYTGLLWGTTLIWGAILTIVGLVCGNKPQSNSAQGLLFSDSLLVKRWWLANLCLLLLSSPIVVWALWRAGVDATAVSAVPTSALRWIPASFGVGQYLPEPWTTGFVVIALLSLWVALVRLLYDGRDAGVLWIVLTLIFPVLLLLAITLLKAKWSERYLLSSFGLALVVGAGAGWELMLAPLISRAVHLPRRFLGAFLALAWLGLAFPALARQAAGTWAVALQDEWHPRPDFRSVAQYIMEHDERGDAIVVIGGYATHTLAYYYQGPAKLLGLPPDTRVLDMRRSLDLHALQVLEQELGDARQLWLVLWQNNLADPTDLVQSLLVEACRRLPVSEQFTNVGLLRFDLTTCRPLDRVTVPPHPLRRPFTEPIALTGYDLLRGGETWEVDLWWKTTAPMASDYLVFVHLVDATGDIVAQHDHIAGADAYPTSRWSPGALMRDRFFLTVPGGTCENCLLRVGLYTEYGRLLLQDGGDFVEIPLPN